MNAGLIGSALYLPPEIFLLAGVVGVAVSSLLFRHSGFWISVEAKNRCESIR